MISGAVTGTMFADVLRTLSLRRRQGILEVSRDEEMLEICFYDGRIVSLKYPRRISPYRLASKLYLAGCVGDEVAESLQGSSMSWEELYQHLIDQHGVQPEEFMLAKKALEFDVLHSLAKLEQAYVHFTPRVIHIDSPFGLSVYPGQLLLDFFALEMDRDQFKQTFLQDGA